jgi:hypothetical protein
VWSGWEQKRKNPVKLYEKDSAMGKCLVGGLALIPILMMGPSESLLGRSQDSTMQHSLLGMRLAEAKETEFFTWFHLEQTGTETGPEKQRIAVFKPSGDTFRKLVMVRTALDAGEHIVRIELFLARSFLDDKKQCVFANDIAKSFLLDATSAADQDAIKGLADSISSNQTSGERIITARPLPAPPDRPGPAYLTYLGKRPRDTEQLSSSTLHLENLKLGDQGWLQMVLSLRK